MAERDAATEGDTWVSATETVLSAVCPLLSTTNEYVTVEPDVETTVGLADLTMVMPATGMLNGEGGEVIDGPLGGVPVAVAESATAVEPRSAGVAV
jgi:hypothetical protein